MIREPLSARRPRWWFETLAIIWLAWVYDAVSNLAPVRQSVAVAHARSVVHLESVLHLGPEHALDHWLVGHPTLGLWVANFYDNAHFAVTFGVLGWLWWRHSDRYRPLRSALVLINVIGLAVYWRYPMAPPRMVPGLHIVDVVAKTGAFGSWHSGSLAQHANELAAMPSLHLAWATWSAWAVWRVVRGRRWAPAVWAYPAVTAVAVISTGNHFLADVLAGVAVTCVAVPVADRLHRLIGRRAWRATAPAVIDQSLAEPSESVAA